MTIFSSMAMLAYLVCGSIYLSLGARRSSTMRFQYHNGDVPSVRTMNDFIKVAPILSRFSPSCPDPHSGNPSKP